MNEPGGGAQQLWSPANVSPSKWDGLGPAARGPGPFQAPNVWTGGSALINVAVGASHQSISGPPGAGLGVTDREAADDGNDLLQQQHQPP